MKPQARIQATIDIFERLYGSRVPLDTVVGDYMRQRRYIGSKDRANVAERVYDIARATARIGWFLERGGLENTARSRVLTWVALGEGADDKRVKDLFDGSKYSPEELNEDELKYFKTIRGEPLSHPDMPLSVRAECPPQYGESLEAYFGDDFEVEMTAMLGSATLDLRVNTVLADKEKVRNFLKADGVETEDGAYAPKALRCQAKTYLSRTKAFGKGWIEIQDEGSQLIAHLCGAQPGMQVLDYCAGAGGKTLALAADMVGENGNPKGRIVAMDLDERRLMKSRERFKKARVSDIIEPRPLSDQRHRKWLKRQDQSFDIVLCDVPCTGTGTWRRNPDMRWNTYGPKLEELTEIQAEILDKVVHAVKPGGKLVYATCSLLPEENENQIEAFLKRHDDFEVEAIDQSLGLGTPYMRLTPHRHQTDGFFTAILKRV
jgi:16S rRNA (cytosine967-C5)-methyltransferase